MSLRITALAFIIILACDIEPAQVATKIPDVLQDTSGLTLMQGTARILSVIESLPSELCCRVKGFGQENSNLFAGHPTDSPDVFNLLLSENPFVWLAEKIVQFLTNLGLPGWLAL